MTIEEFVAKYIDKIEVDAETGCWLWRGCVAKQNGYGRASMYDGAGNRQRQPMAHVLAWECANPGIVRGPDDVIMHDKGCPKHCCNPYHLTLGDAKLNARQQITDGTHFQANKTHCIHGHEFTLENTYRYGPDNKYRSCITCMRNKRRQ